MERVAATRKPRIAITAGDPAGIGPEVIAKCWDNRSQFALPSFVAIGDPRSVANVWDGPIEIVDDPRQADAAFDYGLPLIQLNAAEVDVPGHPSVAGAHTSLDSLEIAVGLARSGSAWAVVTGPVAKEQLYPVAELVQTLDLKDAISAESSTTKTRSNAVFTRRAARIS